MNAHMGGVTETAGAAAVVAGEGHSIKGTAESSSLGQRPRGVGSVTIDVLKTWRLQC
jgi:hypothetical protein